MNYTEDLIIKKIEFFLNHEADFDDLERLKIEFLDIEITENINVVLLNYINDNFSVSEIIDFCEENMTLLITYDKEKDLYLSEG